ncbi:hypothetical protein ACKVV7_011361 [Pyricularia oryzae]
MMTIPTLRNQTACLRKYCTSDSPSSSETENDESETASTEFSSFDGDADNGTNVSTEDEDEQQTFNEIERILSLLQPLATDLRNDVALLQDSIRAFLEECGIAMEKHQLSSQTVN